MKKVLVILGLTVFTFAVTLENSFATNATAAPMEDVKKEKIAADSLPAAVSAAWAKNINAKATIKEINKVTKGTDVTYEISFIDTKSTPGMVIFKADGTEVK